MFAMNVFGPVYKYRLDLLKNSSYEIRDKVNILTDKISYNSFYQEFHDDYNFIMIEDLKNKYELSEKYEIIPNIFTDEEHQFRTLEDFYKEKNNYFPFDIHRFIFPYFLERGIKKFIIIESDMMIINNHELIDLFFETLPEKSIFAPIMGHDHDLESKQKFWNSLNINGIPKDILIGQTVPFYDGWCRGFNFDTLSDMKEFFDLWNTAYLGYLNQITKNTIIGAMPSSEGARIWCPEWIFSECSYIFSKLKNYDLNFNVVHQPGHITFRSPSLTKTIGMHIPRPEDNIYPSVSRRRGAWWDFTFNYDNTKTIKDFIQNNKDELRKYYEFWNFNVEITDTHAYTRVPL